MAYFPDQLGDTWAYSVDFNGSKGTITSKVTAVTLGSGGTQSVSVPAGNYQAMVVDETETELGPGSGRSSGITETEQLIYFTKG